MGLFNLFRKNDQNLNDQQEDQVTDINIPTEEQFIDNSDPQEIRSEKDQHYTLNGILNFASIDFEDRGYHDALTNPESSYKNENVELLLMDLSILIQRAKNYYNHSLQVIDFHINSRKDAGLIDIVNELETRKKKLNENISEVNNIDEQNVDSGLRKRIKLSYNRGFNRGLASMSTELLQTNNI